MHARFLFLAVSLVALGLASVGDAEAAKRKTRRLPPGLTEAQAAKILDAGEARAAAAREEMHRKAQSLGKAVADVMAPERARLTAALQKHPKYADWLAEAKKSQGARKGGGRSAADRKKAVQALAERYGGLLGEVLPALRFDFEGIEGRLKRIDPRLRLDRRFLSVAAQLGFQSRNCLSDSQVVTMAPPLDFSYVSPALGTTPSWDPVTQDTPDAYVTVVDDLDTGVAQASAVANALDHAQTAAETANSAGTAEIGAWIQIPNGYKKMCVTVTADLDWSAYAWSYGVPGYTDCASTFLTVRLFDSSSVATVDVNASFGTFLFPPSGDSDFATVSGSHPDPISFQVPVPAAGGLYYLTCDAHVQCTSNQNAGCSASAGARVKSIKLQFSQ